MVVPAGNTDGQSELLAAVDGCNNAAVAAVLLPPLKFAAALH